MEPLRGIELRSAVVLLLVERHRPLRLADVVVALRRGVYGPGVVAKSTKHRMRARVAATRNRTTRPVG